MSTTKRAPVAMGQLTAKDDSGIGTTIVGGQPPTRRRPVRNVPVGVERVLFDAAGDSAFRAALLEDRKRAIAQRGLELIDSERAMLMAIPAAQLQATINSLDVSPTNIERRSFLGAVALSTMGVAVGVAGCGDDDSAGIRPDDVGLEDQGIDAADRGIRPDMDAGVRDSGPAKEVGIEDSWPSVDGIRPGDS